LREFKGFMGNRDHRLANSNCWTIGIVADYTEVIATTV